MPYDKDQERLFKDLVRNPSNGYPVQMVQFGDNFLRFFDNATGKTFQIAITEYKERKKRK